MPTKGAVRGGFVLLGLACTAIGFINLFIPGLPSTVFFIVALWSFERSSPRLERWLLSNRAVGPVLRDWRETRSISRRTKVVAITTIWAFVLISCLSVRAVWFWMLLGAVGFTLTWFLASRRTAVP